MFGELKICPAMPPAPTLTVIHESVRAIIENTPYDSGNMLEPVNLSIIEHQEDIQCDKHQTLDATDDNNVDFSAAK